MNDKLERELYNIDPIFFKHAIDCINGDENEMQTCMYWGCECGNGWFIPIKNFVKQVAFLNRLGKEYNIQFICDQIKEKFGEFTCYYHSEKVNDNLVLDKENSNILSNMMDNAYYNTVDKCWNTCEWCGAEGGNGGSNMTTTKGWISRICRKCSKEKIEDNTKNFDKNNNEKYIPRITLFNEAYDFLSLYHTDSFKFTYNNETKNYYSIIEAFYSIKDNKNADIYKEIGRIEKINPILIENIAKKFNITYEDNEKDYKLLKDIVLAKFKYKLNENIRKELIETNGKLLSNVGRHCNNILGYCICDNCKDKEHKDLYAKILMEVRDILIKEEQIYANSNKF